MVPGGLKKSSVGFLSRNSTTGDLGCFFLAAGFFKHELDS